MNSPTITIFNVSADNIDSVDFTLFLLDKIFFLCYNVVANMMFRRFIIQQIY